jgi:hypothetical protein
MIVAVATVVLAAVNLVFLGINARLTRKHELRVLTDTRIQQRLEGTYRELAFVMHHMAANTDMVIAAIPIAPGDQISSREISLIVGNVKAFGSDAVIDLMEEWAEVHAELSTAVAQGDVGLMEGILHNLRQKERAVRKAIREELDP